MDVDRDAVSGISMNGDNSDAFKFQFGSGAIASQHESVVLNQFGNSNDCLSTIDILVQSIADNVPIFIITVDNIGKVLPLLEHSTQVLTDITDAINAGYSVIIPKSAIDKNGVIASGYVVQDAITGNAGYYVTGGFSGSIMSGYLLAASGAMAAIASEAWKDAKPAIMAFKTNMTNGWGGVGLVALGMATTVLTVVAAEEELTESGLDDETKTAFRYLIYPVAVAAWSLAWSPWGNLLNMLLNIIILYMGVGILIGTTIKSITAASGP